MFAILKKEINSFFATPIGYLGIGLFLVINGLFLWVFPGNYNILDSGFASLTPFFTIAPWIFLFLIPAITMKSFSEEIRQGTLELLLTKPLSTRDLVLGKFFGAMILIVLALIPTLLYLVAIESLKNPEAVIDWGVITGSYFGLLFLGGCYAAIGLFASILSPNQVVAFILAIFLCFISFFAFEALAGFDILNLGSFSLADLGISAHYDSISRGVIDTRDLVYFLSFIVFFLTVTGINLSSKKSS